MIQSLTNQSSSMLAGLLSGFTAKDRDGAGGFPLTKAARPQKTDALAPNAGATDAATARGARTPDGVPAIVARAFPDFSDLALGIVDRASLGTAASAAKAQTEAGLMDQAAAILGPATGPGSLGDKIEDAIRRLDAWSAQPGDPAIRGAAWSALGGVIDHLGGAIRGFDAMGRDLDASIDAETAAIGQGLARLSQANADLVAARAQGGDAGAAGRARQAALAALAERVDLRFQDRPDGTLIPISADGAVLSDSLDDLTPDAIASGATGGRLSALIDMRDRVLPDLRRQTRAVAAGLTARVNDAAGLAPQPSLTGIDTGLGPNDRLAMTGAQHFVLTDADGKVQAAVTIDFTARTRRTLSTPASAVLASTPATLSKAVTDGLGGKAVLSFADGVFTFAAASDKVRVAVVAADGQPAARGGRSFVNVTGLGRIMDGPVSEGGPSGFGPADPLDVTAGSGLTLRLDTPAGRSLTAQVPADGQTIGDFLARVNDRDGGLGRAQLLSLDRDGGLNRALAPDFLGARLTVTADDTRRAGTGRGLSSLFGLDAPVAPALAEGVDPDRLLTGKARLDDRATRGAALVKPDDTAAIGALASALGAETLVPPALGQATRMVPLADAAREIAAGAATRSAEAARVQQDARAFELALKDERGRLSSASFGAELSHLSTLQTARNVGGRLETAAFGLMSHLDRALARQAAMRPVAEAVAAAPETGGEAVTPAEALAA